MPAGRPIGGSKLANAALSLNRDTIINKKEKITQIEMAPERKGSYYCTCCGKEYKYQRNNFSVSYSPLFLGNNGYLPICKNCMDEYYRKLVSFFSGNEEKALERCCQLFDWFYCDEAIAMTQKCLSANKTRVSQYPSKMNIHHIRARGTSYLDTIKERADKKIESVKDLEKSTEENKDIEISDKDIEFFGSGYTPEEYVYLRNEYEDWITRYEAKSKAQEELFKNITITQLSIQQAKKKGNSKDVTDGMKTLQDLMGSASLKPNQNNDNSLVEKNTFGTLIKRWEDEKPIPEPSEEFKDVDNIKKYIEVYFLGHLAKMLKVENSYSKVYEEEMAKYTVEQPRYVDDDILNDNPKEEE